VKVPLSVLVCNFCSISDFLERAEMSLQGLCDKMTKDHQGPFSLSTLLSVIYDISVGMQFIHSHNIVHRDMSLENFLIFEDFSVKVRSL
jgi:serine/threonine protein kinase